MNLEPLCKCGHPKEDHGEIWFGCVYEGCNHFDFDLNLCPCEGFIEGVQLAFSELG